MQDIVTISASGPVLAELHADGVAHVRLNRPDQANGLNVELLSELHRVIMLLHGDDAAFELVAGAEFHVCPPYQGTTPRAAQAVAAIERGPSGLPAR